MIENFPSKIIYIDAGTDVMTGKGLNQTPPGNILRTAYRDWLWNVERKTLNDQRPSWDLVAIYYAVEGNGKFLDSEYGALQFDPINGCLWKSSQKVSKQIYVSQKDDIQDELADYLNEFIGRPPMKK